MKPRILTLTFFVLTAITSFCVCYGDKRPAPIANHCGAECQDCCTYTLYTPAKEECFSTYPTPSTDICSVGPEQMQFTVDHYKLGDCEGGFCGSGQFDWGKLVTNTIPKLTSCGG
jgi:hypothetical protein